MDPGMTAENIGPLLARANLLRMRGQWSDAADVCAEVLRLAPQNANAHSLLGDIYQDQGRPEEARQWYHLALELHPGSEADRAKLARTEEMLEARQQRAEWQAVIEGKRHPVPVALQVRETVQRIAAISGAVLCGVILVGATLVSMAERPTSAGGSTGSPIQGLLPRVHRPLPPDTPRERDLLTRVSTDLGGHPGQPVRITLDPRTSQAELRVLLPARSRERLTTQPFRALVMREAYRAAYALRAADSSLTEIEVYVMGPVVLPSGAQDNDLLLLSTVSTKDIWQSPDNITPEKINAVFNASGQAWWSSDLRGM